MAGIPVEFGGVSAKGITWVGGAPSAAPNGSESAVLSFTKPEFSDDEASPSYSVEKKLIFGDWEDAVSSVTPGNQINIIVDGLSAETVYQFRVKITVGEETLTSVSSNAIKTGTDTGPGEGIPGSPDYVEPTAKYALRGYQDDEGLDRETELSGWATVGDSVSDLRNRTEDNVRNALDWQVRNSGAWAKNSQLICNLISQVPFVGALIDLAEGAETVIEGLLNGIQNFLTEIAQALGLDTLFGENGALGWIGSLVGLLGDGVQDIVEFFGNAIDWIWNLISGITGGLTNVAGKTLTDVITIISEWFTGIGDFIFNFAGNAVEVIENVTGLNLSSGVAAFIDSLIASIANFTGVFLGGPEALFGSIRAAAETVFTTLQGVIGWIEDATGLNFDDPFSFINSLVGAFGSLVGLLGEGVSQTVQGVQEFFSNAIDLLWNGLSWLLGFDVGEGISGNTLSGLITKIWEWIGNVPIIGPFLRQVDDTLVKPVVTALIGDERPPDIASLGAWASELLGRASPIPSENLLGQISSTLFGVIPVAHISNEKPNLLTQGGFDSAETIDAADGWEWDSEGGRAGGALRVDADNTTKVIYSNQHIPVAKGDKVALQAWIRTVNLTGYGFPSQLAIIPFAGQQQLDVHVVGSVGNTSGAWYQASGNIYVVPANVTSVRVRLALDDTAATGSVYWDDVRLVKDGLMDQGLVERLTDAWNNFWNGIFGGTETGKSVDDVLVAGQAVRNDLGVLGEAQETTSSILEDLITKLLNAPGQILGALGNVLMDGIRTVGEFLSGLWSALTGQSGSGKNVDDVVLETSTVSSLAVTADSAATTANENLQVTWNELYDGLNGSTGSTNRTPVEVRQRGAAVRQKAIDADDKAGLAQLEAFGALGAAGTAQTAADAAQSAAATADAKAVTAQSAAAAADAKAVNADGKAVSAQSAAATADSKAVVAQDLTRTSIAAGANIATNGDFERDTYIGVNAVRSTESPRTGSYSAKITQPGNYYGFVFQAVTDTGHVPYPVSAGDKFYVEFWARGLPTNASTSGNIWFQMNLARSDGLANTGTTTAFTALNDLHDGEWHLCSGTMTIPAYSYECLSSFVVTYHLAPAGNVYYVDNVRFYRITEAFDANVDADAAQATANTGVANAATAQSSANTAQSTANTASTAASNAQSTANTANTAAGTANTNLQTTWNDLFDAFNGSSGSTGKTSANARDRGAAVRNSAVTGEANASTALTNAATAQGTANTAVTNAATADGKAVEAQDLGYQLGNRGANLLPNGSFENSNFYIGASANRGYSSEQKRSGAQSLRCRGYMWTPLFADRNTFYLKSPCAAGDKIYYEIYVRGAVGNVASTRTCFIQTQFFDQNGNYISNSIQYPASVNAGTGLNGVWTKLSGIATAPANAASHDFTIVQLSSTVSGTEANNVYYWDDAKCYRITEAFEAQLDADLGIANAATAQATAATAQTTADSKVPQTFFDAAQRGGDNLATNPVFSDTSQYLWSANASYSTDYKRTGTHSAKVSNNGTHDYYVSVINRSDNSGNAYVTVYPGQVFYCEFYVYQTGGSNSSTVSMYVQLFDYDLTYRGGTFAAAPTFTAANNGVWTKVSGFYVVPNPPANVNYAQARFLLRSHGNTASGTVRYFDDVIVRDVTEAYYAQLDADVAQADANTGIANAAIAKTQADLGVANAANAQGTANTAVTGLKSQSQSGGVNMVFDGGFENQTVWSAKLVGQWSRSTTHKRNGSYSAKCVANGITQSCEFTYTADGTSSAWPTAQGKKYYIEFWVYAPTSNVGNAGLIQVFSAVRNTAASWVFPGGGPGFYVSNLTKGVWTKFSGVVSLDGIDAVYWYPYLRVDASTPSGEFYFDDLRVIDVTDAYEAQLDADAAQADANTGIANAAIAKTQADLGVSNAAAADQKAIVAQQRIEEWASAGASLSTNPGFEDTSQHLGSGWAYSTEQAYSGTRSAKHVSDGSTYVALSATATSSNRLGIKVRPDQVFYLEAYVRGHTNNTATGSSGISLVGVFYRNDLTGPYVVTATTVGATQVGKDNWVKLSGTVIVPADRQLFYPRLDISGSTIPSGNAYYVDWFNTFDITDAYYAQRDVDAATELLNAAVTSGANLIPDPSFENPNLDAARKATSGSVANWWTFVTDVVKTGSRAAEITLYGIPAYPSLNLVPSLKPGWSTDPNIRVPCRPGQVFYLSQWVYLRSPNTGSREVNLYLATFNAANTIVYQVVQAYPALDTWTKIEGYFVVNRADVTGVVPLFGAFRPSNALNSKAVFDDVVMVDVTDAYNAKVAADLAQADANTGIANAAIAQTQADLGVSNAAAAQSTANTARTAIDNAISAGSNLCTNPGAENTSLPINGYNGLVSYSTDYARNGSRSIKFVAANSDNYSYWLFGNTSTWNVWMPCAEGDVFYFEAYVRGVPANTHNFPPYFRLTVMKGSTSNPTYEYPSVHYGIDGVRAESLYTASQINNGWQKITAVWTAPAGSFQFQPYLQVHVSVPQGNTYYADDFKCYRITEAQAANHEAQVAKGISSSVVASADNLCANGDFENTDYLLEALSYTTDEKFSGTRSAALTTLVGWKGAFPVVNSDGSRTRFPCAPGDVFDIRAAIKAKATNVSVSGCWVQITFYTAAGSAIQTQNPIYKQCDPGGFDWLERSGITSPAPANAASVQVSFLSNSPTAGDVIYFDALRLYRITDAYNAQQDADAAQADASTGIANAQTAQTAADAADTKAVVAQKDISNTALSSNLIPDPTFIDPNIQRYGYSYVIPTYTTEESYVGGRCLTWTSAGSTWQGPYFSALQSSKQRFRCSPGDTFNIKLKIKYKSTNNMSAGYVRIFMRFWQSANGGTYTDRVAGTYARNNASFGGTGWLDMNCWGVCPDDRSAVEIFIINDPSTPNGNVYYIDAVRLEQTGPAQEITDTVTQAIAGGSTTGYSLATLKLKVTETKTQADLGVANAGTAQSTTEEVKLALYGSATAAPSTAIQTTAVPTLEQSKVAGLPPGQEVGYEALAETIARLADELASLKADSEYSELSGQNIKVNFSDYGNVTNLATQTALPAKKWQITNVNGTTYTGATWGTLNGNAQFTGNVSSGSGAPKIIYLGDPAVAGSEKTLTDYQRIRGVLSTPPDGYNLSTGGPAFTAIGRVSDDGNSYVWAKAQFVSQLNLRGSIGCRVNGTEYIWADNIPLGFSLEMTFILGADNNPMKFQVFSGTTLVKEHIDNAKDKNNATIPYSLRGDTTTNYRRWGAITAYSNGLTSGKISSVTATDNLPVDYKGSVARMHRTATTDTGTVSTVDNPLPTNFFAAPLFASQDITASSANGTFKVSNSKMYAVNARIQLASYTAANCRIDLQVSTDNGASWTTVQRGATTWAFDSFHNSQAVDYAVTGNWLQYLNAGDMVRLVTRANTGSKTNFLTGGPDGTTYFTISAV